MGASNFITPENADAHYVIGLNEEEDDEIFEFNIENFIEEIRSLIEDTIYKDLGVKGFEVNVVDSDESTNERNYNIYYFSNVTLTKPYSNGDFILNILVGYTSGYYEGATLDFHYINSNGNRLSVDDLIDDIMYDFSYTYNYNDGWLTMMRPNFQKLINAMHTKISEYFNNLFKDISQTQLNRIGGFSDGTSIYEPVK